MAVTLKEVAERAGVSRSAVSRTFTDGASVSAKTRKKVESAAKALGYQPSLIARSLATNRTKLIGLVANNYQNPVFLDVFDLFTKELQNRGYRPLLVNLTDETNPERSLGLLRQYSVDGVIVATSTLPPTFATAFREANIPVVHTFGKFDTTEDNHIVGIDNFRCGEMAAQTFFDRGHRSAAVLGGPETATSTKDRVAGFKARAKVLNLPIDMVRYADNYSYDAGRKAMAGLINKGNFDAVFCGDDLICIGAMDAARAAGLVIPDDIGFLGFNNMPMAGWAAYDLTTIEQPTRDIIRSSVELITALVDNPDRSAEIRLFPCTIIERSTLKSLPFNSVAGEPV
ncbi:MAG: LacI family DNA-binding transcriptional regulator [Stappiaceae bacterium]